METRIIQFPTYDHDLWIIEFRKHIYYVLTFHKKDDDFMFPKMLEIVSRRKG